MRSVRRGLLEPARRPAGEAADHLRAPARAQPADRLLLAVRVRHDRAAARRAGLRLRAAGAGGLDEPDRRAGRAAGEVRALAGRLQRRLRQRAGAAGRRLARAPRRRRLRLRHVAVRDRALAADLRGHVGGVARARRRAPRGVRAPVDRPVPGLPDRGRLDHGRGRQAEVLARAVRGAGAGAGRRPALRGLRGALRAPRAAAVAAAAADRGAADGGGDRAALGAGVPCGAVNDVLGALGGSAGGGARGGGRLRAPAPRRRPPCRLPVPARDGVPARADARRGHRGGPARALRLRRRRAHAAREGGAFG